MPPFDPTFALFVPGDRPDRFDKAANSAASGVILDLEDAVAAGRKTFAREAVAAYLADGARAHPGRLAIRINGPASPCFDDDLDLLHECGVQTVMLPKVSDSSALDTVAATGAHEILPWIETALGVLNVAKIAAHPQCVALAFGPYDLAADLGASDAWEVMLPYRASMLIAARAHDKLALDGPTADFSDLPRLESEARAASRLGYDGKVLIHPAQIGTVRSAFAPTPEQAAHAARIVEVAERHMPAVLDGKMIDEPIVASARRLLRRTEEFVAKLTKEEK